MLQYFPPPEDPAIVRSLTAVLKRTIAGSDVAKNVNKNNAQVRANLLTVSLCPSATHGMGWVHG